MTRFRTQNYIDKRRKGRPEGYVVSEITKRKIGDAQLGEKNHMWGKTQTEESNVKRSSSLKGKKKSPEHIRKMSEAQRGIPRPHMAGENHPNWKGGWTQEKIAGRPKPATCEVCGSGSKIVFDHDRQTGKFRGWICNACNIVLGHSRDNVEVLYKLISYLNQSRGLVEISEVPSSLANVLINNPPQ